MARLESEHKEQANDLDTLRAQIRQLNKDAEKAAKLLKASKVSKRVFVVFTCDLILCLLFCAASSGGS